MKNLVIVLLILTVFFACAFVGYQIAGNLDILETTEIPTSGETQQYRLIVVHVDDLASDNPRLISTWFLSLFFQDGLPPTITFAKIYPASTDEGSLILERSFDLDRDKDPSAFYLQSIRAMHIQWDGFLVMDQMVAERTLNWVIGPGDYSWVASAMRENPGEVKRLLEQACHNVGGIDNRETATFSWGDLVPAHFHSNLPMEKALVYWERVTKSSEPLKCDVVLK